MTLLSVQNLRVYYKVGNRLYLKAVDNISFSIAEGEIVALVGESGSGKSTVALAILRLLPPVAEIIGGEIIFKGRNILSMVSSELRSIRGKEIGTIFQEPVSYLNPLIKVGEQITECLMVHEGLDKITATEKAKKLLEKVRIPDPDRIFHHYPHQLSGGMAQRVALAIAISCNPSLLIADEPTSNLDVTVQAQILNMLKKLNTETMMSILLITHDLGVVSGIADRVIVMYAGKLVEDTDVKNIFSQPLHPYSKLLLQSSKAHYDLEDFDTKGFLPDLTKPPLGCRFAPRCPYAMEKCTIEPAESRVNSNHRVYCWLYGD
jgi:oligopeptide/dipeptide ABC transporter ATP-binding protein